MKYPLLAVTFVALICNVQGKLQARRLRQGEPCDTAGFFGDAEDCMKFYRCAEHETEDKEKPLFVKFTFQCPVGTAFDEALSTCNFPHSLMNLPPNCPMEIPPPAASPPAEEESEGSVTPTTTTAQPPTENNSVVSATPVIHHLTAFSGFPFQTLFFPQAGPAHTAYSNVIYFKK